MDADGSLDKMAAALVRVGRVVIVRDGPGFRFRWLGRSFAIADEAQAAAEGVAGATAEGFAQEASQFSRRHRCDVRSVRAAAAARTRVPDAVGRAGTSAAAGRRGFRTLAIDQLRQSFAQYVGRQSEIVGHVIAHLQDDRSVGRRQMVPLSG